MTPSRAKFCAHIALCYLEQSYTLLPQSYTLLHQSYTLLHQSYTLFHQSYTQFLQSYTINVGLLKFCGQWFCT